MPKNKRFSRKSQKKSTQESGLQLQQIGETRSGRTEYHDPAADQHHELSKEAADAANRAFFTSFDVPTNRLVQEFGGIPSQYEHYQPPMHHDPAALPARITNDAGETIRLVHNEIPADFPRIDIKEPEFAVTEGEYSSESRFHSDLMTAIEHADVTDVPESAREIADALLKHPDLSKWQELEGIVGYTEGGVEGVDFEIVNLEQAEYADDECKGEAPSEQEFLGNEEGMGRLMDAINGPIGRDHDVLVQIAKEGIMALQELAGMAAESKGFHEDRPKGGPELTNWQGNKLMLIVSEAVEAHDEIRSGKAAWETYYPDATIGDNGKPEGVPSEIADVVIRAADFAWTEGFELAEIIIEKLAYNATRGHKHGKKF